MRFLEDNLHWVLLSACTFCFTISALIQWGVAPAFAVLGACLFVSGILASIRLM